MELTLKNCRFEIDENGVATLTIDREDVRNALDLDTWNDLDRFIEYADTEPSIRAVVITGAGQKSFAAGAPEMIFKNPDAIIIHPSSGDYETKLNYISNENFNSFDYTAKLKLNEAEITTYSDVGCTVNFKDFSLIIYVGSGDINLLFGAARHKNPILICADNLNQEIKYPVSRCIISGDDNTKSNIAKNLKSQKINYEILGAKTVSIQF